MTHSSLPSSLPIILAVDTSCDDTSAAVTQGSVILSNIIASQTELHRQYGGVFPTVAKQAHRENILPTIQLALDRAQVKWSDIDALAVTQGPGLAPALEVGIAAILDLAEQHHLPVIPVNHIEGHLLSSQAVPRPLKKDLSDFKPSPWPNPAQKFPILGVIVSGGHTEFIKMTDWGKYERIGFTVDDAAGEALDKFGRMINLGYPAGPVVEQFARLGLANTYPFPLPMTTSGNANMSFSGLKTAARTKIEELTSQNTLTKDEILNLCASFQYAVFHAITYKLSKILVKEKFSQVWLGGGVVANLALRSMLRRTLRPFKLELSIPYTKKLCADNAAMIGVVAGLYAEKYIQNFAQNSASANSVASATSIESEQQQPKTLDRRPRWEIDQALS